jgi:hypothetical protein
LALVVLSVVEQRLDAVRAALNGGDVEAVAASVGGAPLDAASLDGAVSDGGSGWLSDRSHRPDPCPHQVRVGVEVAIAELQRKHSSVLQLLPLLRRRRQSRSPGKDRVESGWKFCAGGPRGRGDTRSGTLHCCARTFTG